VDQQVRLVQRVRQVQQEQMVLQVFVVRQVQQEQLVQHQLSLDLKDLKEILVLQVLTRQFLVRKDLKVQKGLKDRKVFQVRLVQVLRELHLQAT
jgi:hypothetical protein